MDYEELRELMVKMQLIPRGIKDERVLNAMKKVPRHLFVEDSFKQKAYDDTALSIGEGQTISQPYMVAIMTELMELKGDEKILEVGTGSGYQAVILAELAREVYTIERVASLANKAKEKFSAIGYNNIHIMVGDGTLGWQEEAPFDRIIITAGGPKVPEPLIEQMSEDGIIVAPIGDRFTQLLLKIIKSEGRISKEEFIPCVFVPLIGAYGWREE